MSNYIDLVERLRTRATIRRNITDRKSVQEGKPDRIADLLEEAAAAIVSILQVSNEQIEERDQALQSTTKTDSDAQCAARYRWLRDAARLGERLQGIQLISRLMEYPPEGLDALIDERMRRRNG